MKSLFAVVILIILSIPLLTKADGTKMEAKRYLSEYKSKRHAREFDGARRKLEAAIALDPDEALYLYELAKLQGSRVPPYKPAPRGEEYYTVKRFMNLFGMFKESIEIYDRVAKRFPSYPKPLYGWGDVQGKMFNIYINIKNQSFSAEQRQYIREVMKDYRKKAYPQMQKHYWKFDLRDGINSAREYKFLFHFYDRQYRFSFFFDYKDQSRYAYKSTIKFLELTRDFMRKHPELIKKAKTGARFRPENVSRRALAKILKENNRLIMEHPEPQIRKYGEALGKGKTFPKQTPLNNSCSGKALKIKKTPKHLDVSGKTLGIMNKYLINFMAADNYQGHIYLLSVDQRQSAKILHKNKNVALKIYDYDMKTGQWHIVWKMDKYLNRHVPLRKNWKIRAMKDYLLIIRKDHIIVIAKDNFSFWIIKDLPIDEIRDLTILNNRIYAFLGRINMPGATYALETMLMSCNLKGNDRKIHISTMKRDSKHFFDRKKAFIVSGLFADPERNRLLFSAEYPIGGLWEYYPDTGAYKQLIKQSRNYSSTTWGRKNGNKLYLRFGIRGKYYVYDLVADKAEYLFFDEEDQCAKREKEKARFQKYLNVGSQFITTDDRVWFADRWRVKCFENKKPISVQQVYTSDTKASCDLSLSEIRYIPFPLYPHPDGKTMVLVTNHYIFEWNGVSK